MMGDLNRLMRPKTIAVIGGGSWGTNVVEQCQKIGFSGEIWPVHPKRNTVCGLKAYPNVTSLPSAPDATFIGVNRDATIDVVAELSAMGAGGAVCFASGFLEAKEEISDGAAKQDALLAAAGPMKIIGPNCYGFLNYLDGVALWPDQHGGEMVSSGVAIITQSSNIAINLTMQKRGLPLAYMVTAGNQAQTGLSEIGIALLLDKRVTALGLHIEGIDDLRSFEALAATARELGKPIVALKVGKSNQAQAAAISHTASLAGSYAGACALLTRLGIGQASSLSALLESLKLLHVAGPLGSNRIASMSCSGGEASLMVDSTQDTGLVFPPLIARQKTKLREVLGRKVALANPLDYHTYIWGDEEALTQTFTAMMEPHLALGIVVLDFPRADRCTFPEWEAVLNAVVRTQKASGCPMAILGSISETMPEDIATRMISKGIVPFCGMPEAMEAMEIAAFLGFARCSVAPILLPESNGETRTLTEAEAKAALALHGIRVPIFERVEGAKAAVEAATRIGFPVVLKGEGIAHKTEIGAVAVNLMSKDGVLNKASTMPTNNFLVEEMITDTVAELLVGVICDPAHGYVLTLAAGGILTELLHDATSLLIPATRIEVFDALGRLKIAKLLDGYRGGKATNKDAIIDAVMAVQAYVIAQRPQEVEINPLMCGPHAAIAADALINIGETHA